MATVSSAISTCPDPILEEISNPNAGPSPVDPQPRRLASPEPLADDAAAPLAAYSDDRSEDPRSNPRSSHPSISNPTTSIPHSCSSLAAPPFATRETLLHLSFNQDAGCFAAGTDRGFRIHNCDPFREIFRRSFNGGGIGVVEMLFRCNFLALVGGGPHPHYPLAKVMIWDDHQSRCIGELSFRSEVRSVRLRRDRIVVVLDHKIFVYKFSDLKLVHQIETFPNPKGLCAVSQHQGTLILVCPGGQKGQLRVELYGARRTIFVMAHESRIACLALSQDGRLIATASTKGTLIRVFRSVDGALLQEVRRGADRAEIYSLAFSANVQWLAVSSDKGTVHVFDLKVDLALVGNDKLHPLSEPNAPAVSSLPSILKGVLPKYFHSEWSVAQFRLREGSQYVVAFGHQKNTLVILGFDGSFFRCEYDPVAGGEMKQLECYNFLEKAENC